MDKNLTIEEFNEKVSVRVLANFEAYTDGIIKNIDKKFTKSYARLIKDYLDDDSFTLGRYYYSLMKTFCKKEEFCNFSDVIQRIENEISEKDAFANSFSSLKQAFKQK